MSNSRTSVLVPLGQKSKVGTSYVGLSNPTASTALSSTPSPLATPMSSKSIDDLKMLQTPLLPPAPSPTSVSSNLVAKGNLPLVTVPPSTPSPDAVRANHTIKSSLATLNKLPPSPRMPGVGIVSFQQSTTPVLSSSSTTVSALPTLSGAPVLSSVQGSLPQLPLTNQQSVSKLLPSNLGYKNASMDVKSSLLSLQSMPPSPRLSSSTSTINMSGTPESTVNTSSSLATGLSLPALAASVPPSPKASKASVEIQKSLLNLKEMPPSPRMSTPVSGEPISLSSSSTLQKLPEFSGKSAETTTSCSYLPSSEPKLSLTPSETLTAADLGIDSFDEKPVEATLLEFGYVPTDKVITKDEDGLLVCQYLKAVDKSGRTVFVDMDCDGFVSVDPKNMTMVKVSDASVVPYSIKMGAYDCAASDVCGVAFECDGEVCTLKRSNKDLTPSETVFTSASKDGNTFALMPNYPIPYPIVNLSDIKNKPAEVASSIKDSHDRMRRVAFGHVERDTQDLDKSTASLVHEVRKFEEQQKEVSSKLSTTLKEFETMNDRFIRKPPTTDNGKSLQRTVQFNLRKRNDMVLDYLTYSEAVNSRAARIKELAAELKDLNDLAEQLFDGVGNVYQE
jgi:hypothetical protein